MAQQCRKSGGSESYSYGRLGPSTEVAGVIDEESDKDAFLIVKDI
jgi:hypothetical protein